MRVRPHAVASWLSRCLVGVALVGVVALVAWPWLRADTRWLETGDGPNHLLRIYVVDAALRRGEWYPRWLSDLYLGYGYPLLYYYAPDMYYIAAAFGALGLTVYGSLVWTGAVGIVLGATGAFALAAAVYPNRRDAALLAAAVYVLAPYPFFANLYGRAAVPEALALGLLPWLLRAGLGAWQGSRRWMAGLSLAVAALPLTHNISALLALGLLAVWLAALPWLDRVKSSGRKVQSDGGGAQPDSGAGEVAHGAAPSFPSPLRGRGARGEGRHEAGGQAVGRTTVWRGWLRAGGAAAAGLALSAFFWLPALAETGYVQIDRARGGRDRLHDWLFTWPDLLLGLTRAHQPDVAGPGAGIGTLLAYAALGKSAPERVDLAQALLWLLALGVTLLVRTRRRPALFWCGVAAFCWAMNGAPAMWLWLHGPLLTFVQFPWRLYGPLSLAVAMAAAAALVSVGSSPRRLTAARAVAGGAIVLLAAGSIVSKPYVPGPPPAHDVDGQDLFADETNRYGGGTTTGGEFLPKTVQFAVYTRGHDRGIMLYDDARDEAGWQAGLVRVLDGQATVTGISRAPDWIGAEVQADNPSTIAFHQLLIPGWRAYVDGRPAALQPVPYFEPLQARFGYMVVDVPPGAHRVEVHLGPTGLRLAADALSAATAAALLVVWASWLISRRQPSARLAAGPAQVRVGAGRRPHFALALGALAAAVTVGAEVRAAEPPPSVPASANRLALDVAGAVVSGQADTAAPGGSGHGTLPPFLDVRYEDVAGEVRRWLYMHPPTRAAARLRVPAHAYFQAGLALDPQTWQTDVGDGVRFVVEADGPAGHTVLLDRRINPRANVDERRWVDVWVSLENLAGQDVTLTLRTDPVEDLNYDWAGWANPQVVIWDSARPNPGAPHPF